MQTQTLAAVADIFRSHEDSVLFVTSQLRPRELKLAHGLRRLGWKTAILYYHWTPFEPTEEFDFSLAVASAEEAHRVAKELAPRICHVFSGAIDDLVLTFCRDKPCPVVIDLNDVFAPSMFDYCHERFEPTREALALADGFCARDLQATRAQRIDGFALPPHVIFFPEYCWNERQVAVKSDTELASSEVRVVSVGTFSLETQGMYDSCYLQLVNLFRQHEIHFHIYPHWSYRKDHHGSPHARFETDFADFLEMERRSPYVHVHDSLDLDALASVLPEYDFGIVSGGCEAFGQRLKYYKPAYLQTCYSGRISDFLDARLPVLVNDEVEFDFQLLRHYGACVDLKGVLQPGFRDKLLATKRDPRTRIAVDRAALKMSVQHNSPRLARFYTRMIKAGKRPGRQAQVWESSINAPSPYVPRAATPPSEGQFVETARRLSRVLGMQHAAPRIARVVMPYRTIRLLERVAHLEKTDNAELIRNNVLQRLDIERLKREVDDLSAALESLTERESRQRAHLVAARRQSANAIATGDKLAREKEALEALAADLGERLGGARGRSSALQSELAQAESAAGALRARVEALEAEKAILEDQAASLEVTRETLAAQVTEMTATIRALTERLDDCSRREESALTRVGELASASETLRTERDHLRDSVSVLRSALQSLESGMGVVRTNLEEVQRTNGALSAKLEERERGEATLRSELFVLRGQMEAARAERDQASLALATFRAEYQSEALTLRGQAESARVERDEANAALMSCRTELRTLETDNATLSQRVHVLSNERFLLQQASTIGGLPLHELAGALNWPNVIDDVQRVNGHAELVRVMCLYAASKHAVDDCSNCWEALGVKNYDQLLTSGYDQFKRTIGLNYFNFAVQANDPQIVALESLLRPDEVARCAALADGGADDPSLPWHPQREYRRFVAMLWAYAKTIDGDCGLSELSEPEEGGAIWIDAGGSRVTQDLANAIVEYHSIRDGMDFDDVRTVLEIGGGYGRTVFPMLARHPDLRVTMVDIPPALYIAQRYLSSVFRERRVFRVRSFDRYDDVREEMEQASIVFLMPHQLGLLPDRYFDLALNISSFGEMTTEQIRWYFDQIDRTVGGSLYLKQWRTSNNVFDGVVTREDDYPYPPHWRRTFSRACAVQTEFFEALYQVNPKR